MTSFLLGISNKLRPSLFCQSCSTKLTSVREKKTFQNGVKDIQAASCNGARTVKSRSSKNPGLDKSNLPQNSNFGREFVQKSGVQIPAPEGQKILFFFLFIFKFFTQKWISFI